MVLTLNLITSLCWCIGVTCAVLYCMQVIMCECWGITFASVHDLSTGFLKGNHLNLPVWYLANPKLLMTVRIIMTLESMQHNTSNNTGTNTKSS